MAHLKDLAKDSEFQWLLATNLDLLKASLITMQDKAHFILVKEYQRIEPVQQQAIKYINHLKFSQKSHNQDEGFIKKVSAYYHDIKCINSLLNLLEEYKNIHSLDLNNKIDRYWLGYLFVQIGELAKEISDFIKPQSYNDAESNLTRFFFGKLGHYRQEIKNHPSIVYDINNNQLFQMKFFLEKALDEKIIEFLKLIKSNLLDSLIIVDNDKGDIDYEKSIVEINNKYATVNSPTRKEKFSSFEKNNLEQLKKLIIIIENSTTNNLEEKIARYEKHQATLKEKIQNLKKEYEEQIKLTGNQQNVINIKNSPQSVINDLKDQILKSRQALEIRILANENNFTVESTQNLKNTLTPKQFELLNLIKTFVVIESGKLLGNKSNIVKIIFQKIVKYEQDIEKAINKFINIYKKNKDNYSQYKNIIELLYDKSNDKYIELFKNLHHLENITPKKDLSLIERQLKSAQEEYKNLKSKVNATRTHSKECTDNMTNLSTVKEKVVTKAEEPNTKVNKEISIVNKITHELENLREIEQAEDITKIDYARKMVIGFVGQYFKELSNNLEFQNYISEDTLFKYSMQQTTITRHKFMHGMVNNLDKSLSSNTSQEHLLPWQRNYECLKIIMLNDHNYQELILDFLPQIPAWNPEEEQQEKEIFIKMLLMGAYTRLRQYSQAQEIFQGDIVQDYINNDNGSPVLRLYLLIHYTKILFPIGDDQNIKKALENCIDYLVQLKEKIPELYSGLKNIKNDILADLLLVDKDLDSPYFRMHFNDPNHQLKLADKLLENLKYDEALNIIRPILKEFEENDNSFNDGSVPRFKIGYDCYALMSMYYRCVQKPEEAIEYLNLARNILEQYLNEATQYWGGLTKAKLFDNSINQSACYSIWGQLLIYNSDGTIRKDEISRESAKEKFKQGYQIIFDSYRNNKDNPEKDIINFAKACTALGSNKAHLGKLNNNSADIEMAKLYLTKAENYIKEVTDSNAVIGICELWIDLSIVYRVVNDPKKEIFCMAQAENNKYWLLCAEHRKVPLSYEATVLGEFPCVSIQSLLWNEVYGHIINDETNISEDGNSCVIC